MPRRRDDDDTEAFEDEPPRRPRRTDRDDDEERPRPRRRDDDAEDYDDRRTRRRGRDERPAPRRSLKALWITLGIVGLLVAAGGAAFLIYTFTGETNQQVLDRYKAKYDARRQQLRDLANRLPPVGSVQGKTGKKGLNPPPTYDPRSKNYNISILMMEHLRDPEYRFKDLTELNLITSEGDLHTGLVWTGPANPMVEHIRRQKAGDLAQRLDEYLAYPYLGVVRTVKFAPPLMVGQSKFVGGTADVEAFVVDLRNNDVVASVRVQAQSDRFVDGREDAMPSAVYSSMMTALRKELTKSLSEATGGTIDLDYR